MIYFDREVMEEAMFQLTGNRELAERLMDEAYKKKK